MLNVCRTRLFVFTMLSPSLQDVRFNIPSPAPCLKIANKNLSCRFRLRKTCSIDCGRGIAERMAKGEMGGVSVRNVCDRYSAMGSDR